MQRQAWQLNRRKYLQNEHLFFPIRHSNSTLSRKGVLQILKMKLQEWIAKWSNPHWMPQDPRKIVSNLTSEHIGQLNLMWIFLCRKPITQGFFDQNLNLWELAGRICSQNINNISVRDYATIYTEDEFYRFVCQNPDVFGLYFTMTIWKQHFTKKRHRQSSI